MSEALRIARALRGIPSGSGYLVRCPVPSHGKGRGDRRPSLSIADGDSCLLVSCHAGCHHLDVLDALRRQNLLDDREERRSPPRAALPVETPEDIVACRMWNDADPLHGTLAESYLLGRGLTTRSLDLRFLAAGHSRFFPAMIAALRTPTRRLIAAQVTYLDPKGRGKARIGLPRRTFGAMGYGAVQVGELRKGGPLGLAEGSEDALAAMQLTGVPTWASLGAGRMHRVAIPETVTDLHVFADDDEPGRAAAQRVAEANKHRTVRIRLPPPGCADWAAAVNMVEAR